MSNETNLRLGSGPEPKRFRDYEKCRVQAINDARTEGLDVGTASRRLEEKARDPDFQREVSRRYLSSADYQAWESGQKIQWQIADELDANTRYLNLIMLVPYLLVFAAGMFLILRALRPWRLDSQSGLLRFGGRSFTFYQQGGVVVQAAASRSTHHVPGSQTIATNQYGHSHVVSSTAGYSYTTLHETIHLIDGTGHEQVLRLDDWSISARGGHVIGAMHAIRKGRRTGPYLRVWNFTLDETTSNRAAIKKMFGLGFLGWAGLTLSIGNVGLLLGGIFAALSVQEGMGAAAAVPVLLSFPFAMIAATVVHLRVRKRRTERFEREISAPLRASAEREARAAADRTLGPVSRAD
ncbi:MAG: hypothetical protein KF730_07155 [Sphingomonas sp.]|uniref:hypothetical protein n=1 Tax=Sphingomonas sp. TaxID=28214 RepID=UPI0025FAFDA0|nr:hypothetical protein [Sphingomonas sp.]MBX3564339.1 hypothetical protein [Sphingomonas sp.]